MLDRDRSEDRPTIVCVDHEIKRCTLDSWKNQVIMSKIRGVGPLNQSISRTPPRSTSSQPVI